MGKDDIISTVSGLPPILGLDVNNILRPKWEYLTRHLGGTLVTVAAFPEYFVYSLTGRIMLRHRFLLSLGRMPELKKFMQALRVSDEAFLLDYAESTPEAFEAFKHEAWLAAGGGV